MNREMEVVNKSLKQDIGYLNEKRNVGADAQE